MQSSVNIYSAFLCTKNRETSLWAFKKSGFKTLRVFSLNYQASEPVDVTHMPSFFSFGEEMKSLKVKLLWKTFNKIGSTSYEVNGSVWSVKPFCVLKHAKLNKYERTTTGRSK